VGEPDTFWQHATAADLAELHARGHELGCHTYSHLKACDLDTATLEREVIRNRTCFERLVPGARLANFAFPFGIGTFRGKRQLARHFKTSRSIVPGINRGRVDLQFLKSVPLIDREIDRSEIDDLMDATVADNGWLIFYGHDVCRRPSAYGCSEALLDHALKAAKRRDVALVSIAEGLQAAQI
jgi:peptidoglycan/xylan/chitin deacetylase (PgdA/CDA1 family)